MSVDWAKQLRLDPLPFLLGAHDPAITFWTKRDLLGEDPGPVQALWNLPAVVKILRKQLPDGSWAHSPPDLEHPALDHGLVEAWRHGRCLVYQYGMNRENEPVARAAERIMSTQTAEGDFRGILANQLSTYYQGALTAMLIDAGYGDDPRIERSFQFLLRVRQDDGAWTIPMLTHKLDRETWYRLASEHLDLVELDRSKPFSHTCTGMVLRAFAAHPRYQSHEAALTGARLLKGRFFQEDAYTSLQSAAYWVRFEYPFWWNNLVSAMDSISLIGLGAADPDMARGLAWLVEHQRDDGGWSTTYAKPEPDKPLARERRLWVTLAVCRLLRRLLGQP